MEDADDTIVVASSYFGGVGIAEAIILSIYLGLHAFAAGTMGFVSLNHSSLLMVPHALQPPLLLVG